MGRTWKKLENVGRLIDSTLAVSREELPSPRSRIEARMRESIQPMAEFSSGILASIKSLCSMPRLNADENVLEFWESKKFESGYKNLYILSQVVLAVPATQVSVERAFSALTLILSDRRTRMLPDLIDDILIIKLNKNLYRKLNVNFEIDEIINNI